MSVTIPLRMQPIIQSPHRTIKSVRRHILNTIATVDTGTSIQHKCLHTHSIHSTTHSQLLRNTITFNLHCKYNTIHIRNQHTVTHPIPDPATIYTTCIPPEHTQLQHEYNIPTTKKSNHSSSTIYIDCIALRYLTENADTIAQHSKLNELLQLAIHYDLFDQLPVDEQKQHIIKIYTYLYEYETLKFNYDLSVHGKLPPNRHGIQHRYNTKCNRVHDTNDANELNKLYQASMRHKIIYTMLPTWMRQHKLSSTRLNWLHSEYLPYNDARAIVEHTKSFKQTILQTKLQELQYQLERSNDITLQDKYRLLGQQRQAKTVYDSWYYTVNELLQSKKQQYEAHQYKKRTQLKFDAVQQYLSRYEFNKSPLIVHNVVELIELISKQPIETYKYIKPTQIVEYISVVYCDSVNDMRMLIDCMRRLIAFGHILPYDIQSQHIQYQSNRLNHVVEQYPLDLYELPAYRLSALVGNSKPSNKQIRQYSQYTNVKYDQIDFEQYYVIQLNDSFALHIYPTLGSDSAAIQYDNNERYLGGERVTNHNIFESQVNKCHITIHS